MFTWPHPFTETLRWCLDGSGLTTLTTSFPSHNRTRGIGLQLVRLLQNNLYSWPHLSGHSTTSTLAVVWVPDPRERCRTWISILWKVDTSYTVPVLANCTHSMALICDDKKWSLVVKSWLLAPSLTDRDRLLPHL